MYRFRCTSNPNGPIVTVENLWEAKEMRTHIDYVEIDEKGAEVKQEEDGAPNRIPFAGSARPKLGLPKRK